MRFSLILVAMATLVVAGCSNPKPKAAAPVHQDSLPVTAAPGSGKDPDIGDVEFALSCVVNIDVKDRGANIKVEETKDYKGNVALVSAEATGIRPVQLPVSCTLLSSANFADTPVAIRGRVLRETTPGQQEEIGTFSAVAGANARKFPKREEGQPPAVWTFDALKGLDSLPESVLITAELTMMMTASGTAETTLNPDTANVATEFKSIEVSNPLRLNLHFEPQPNQPVTAVSAPAGQ